MLKLATLAIATSALASLVLGAGALQAAPVLLPLPETSAPIVRVANGCGPGYFRTIAGDCEPNLRIRGPYGRRLVAPPPCPRGFRRDPRPGVPVCYPIY